MKRIKLATVKHLDNYAFYGEFDPILEKKNFNPE